MTHARLLPVLFALLLLPLAAVGVTAGAAGSSPSSKYDATVTTTEHGIPHIEAADWGSLGYGSGYAAAGAATCTLADTLLTARGERSLYLGGDARYNDQVTLEASNLQVDAFVTDLRNREVVEDLLASDAGPSDRAREMVRGYVAGINRWLTEHEVTDPACAEAAYLEPDATELDLWYGVYLANMLASSGVFVEQIVDAAPPTPTDPGLPELPVVEEVDREALMEGLGRGDVPFGSNATAIGSDASSTGRGLLLGNPHFPWQGRYRFTQQHLTIPGEYDVAGASLIGSPVVNIGWNADVAWSHTVSTAYRFTPYEYVTVAPGTTYATPNGLRSAERRTVEVEVLQDDGSVETVSEDLYRTPQGYVIDSPAQLMPWSPTSFWAIRDANAEHLRTIDTFLAMGEATSATDLVARQDAEGGMPWVNTTAADRNGEVVYADHSVVPHVTDAMAQRCMTVVGRVLETVAGLPGLNGNLADSGCAWGSDDDAQRPGIFGPNNLPDTTSTDWVMNANDSYWLPHPDTRLEGYAGIIGCERCVRTMRTRMVMQYVVDRLAEHGRETPASLRGHQYENRVRAAEVMREDGALDEACAATGEAEACAVLAAWDGRSEADSVGTHLFEEFVVRAPTGAQLWRTPFDPEDPLHTPRDLRSDSPTVIDAMQQAIDAVRDRGVAFDARWGDLQVSADPGAPPLPLGGGTGDLAGNANALASRDATTHTDRYRPVTYGSSHIQAVAYRRDGSVDARTILTYGQYEDPDSPWSSDQTQMFSEEEWVDFPWTRREIARATVGVQHLRE